MPTRRGGGAPKVVEVVVAARRSPWIPVGVVAALVFYLLGHGLVDVRSTQAAPDRMLPPDDEIMEL